jgi:hypothetical protein
LERTSGSVMAHLDRDAIEAAYAAAPGNEIASGKFASAESSAALAANTFGLFFPRPDLLPTLPGTERFGWPAQRVTPEAIVRFPWAGGRHPCLDALVETSGALIGVESKRYEPFRPKAVASLSAAYWRPVWGERLHGYLGLRDDLRDGRLGFIHLDATQLVKHALGLRTAAVRQSEKCSPVLIYLYAEPDAWPDGRPIARGAIDRHCEEISFFSARVQRDEVIFLPISYGELLAIWRDDPSDEVRRHAEEVAAHFSRAMPTASGGAHQPLWRSDEGAER